MKGTSFDKKNVNLIVRYVISQSIKDKSYAQEMAGLDKFFFKLCAARK